MASVLEKLNKLMKKHITEGSDIPFIAVPSTFTVVYIMLLLSPFWRFFTLDDNDMMKECFTIVECLTYPVEDIFHFSILLFFTFIAGCGWLISYPSDKATYSEEFSQNTLMGMPFVMLASVSGIVVIAFLLDSYSPSFGAFEITRLTILKGAGICTSVLTIVIVFLALSTSESVIEAAASAWLMLTVLGAIFAIIIYLTIL